MTDKEYMQICIDLASKGLGHTAPNPLVGAIVVNNGEIIGRGFHEFYGGPHAEVNAINHVENKELLKTSVLYVNLEPCSHYGKTPPCADLILEKKIPKVVIGSSDPFPEVSGRGIAKLEAHKVDVTVGILEDECRELNRRFYTFYEKKRPYIILKWAQTGDGFIAEENQERGKSLKISNEETNVLVHTWRSEEQGILVGKNTVLKDDPMLNVRLIEGKDPVVFIMSDQDEIPKDYQVWKRDPVFLGKGNRAVENLNTYCFENKIQSVLVEGGSAILNHFLKHNIWDEARVITNSELKTGKGVSAPKIEGNLTVTKIITDNLIHIYFNPARL